jgi:hypothetical protein
MATTDRAAQLHEPLCRGLLERLNAQTENMTFDERFDYLVRTGVVDAGRLYEIVSSLETGIALESVDGKDLADGSNCKLSGSYGPVNGQQTAYGWRINVQNCVGDVRALLHHPKEKKTYELHVPLDAHRNQKWLTVTDCKRGARFGRFTHYVKAA